MSLARWLIILLVVVLAALSLSVGAMYLFLSRTFTQRQQVQEEAYVKILAERLAAQAEGLRRQVEILAIDPDRLDDGGREAKAVMSGVLWMRLLPVDLQEDEASLGFADIDLLQRALQGDPPLAMHGLSGSQRYVAFARAVRRGGEPVAVLLTAFSPESVLRALPVPAEGALALMQGDQVLVYRGDSGLKTRPPTWDLPVAGTLWRLRYWSRTPQDGLVYGLAIWSVALGVILFVFYLLWRWWRQAIVRDRSALLTIANDMANGAPPQKQLLALRELQPLCDRLLMLGSAGWGVHERYQPGTLQDEAVSEVEPLAEPTDGAGAEAENGSQRSSTTSAPSVAIPERAFGGCSLRARETELPPEAFRALGQALGSEIRGQGERRIAVGRDPRPGSEVRCRALIEGLRASGCDVLDTGMVPLPMIHFAGHHLHTRYGVLLTGGSGAEDDTGLKVVCDGRLWDAGAWTRLRQRLAAGGFEQGLGALEEHDLLADYIGAIVDDVQLGRPLKVVVDVGVGGVEGVVPALLRTLGCELEVMRSQDVSDPALAGALVRLQEKVRQDDEAELGLAFDGDGDRVAVVDAEGRWIPNDRVLMLLAADVLSREPGGDVVFDRECGRHLPRHIVKHGGRPLLAPGGSCRLQAKAEETGAVLAGGFSGHLLFRERWIGSDDAIYGAARLVEILSAESATSGEVFAALPQSVSTPYLEVELEQADNAMKILEATAEKFFTDAKVEVGAGVRVDFADGWGLVRPAYGRSALRFRFEADAEADLARIQTRFKEWFETVELEVFSPFDRGDA